MTHIDINDVLGLNGHFVQEIQALDIDDHLCCLSASVRRHHFKLFFIWDEP